MTMMVQSVQHVAIASIAIDNPPVNVLTARVRAQLLADLEMAIADPQAKIIVVHAKGKTFVSGADLKEFEEGTIAQPDYRTVLGAIERSTKPVVAVLHGTAFGAGLELAMACHYRVAAKATRIGLPEMTLGLVPGAGATQRLPRLVGMEVALDMLLGGGPVSADQSHASGLIDEIGEGEPEAIGRAFVEHALTSGLVPRPTCAMDAEILNDELVAAALNRHSRALRGRNTQHSMIAALKASRLPIEDGLDEEWKLSAASIASRESQARAPWAAVLRWPLPTPVSP